MQTMDREEEDAEGHMTETIYCRILNYLITRPTPFEALKKYTDNPQNHYRNRQSDRDRYDLDIFLFTCC